HVMREDREPRTRIAVPLDRDPDLLSSPATVMCDPVEAEERASAGGRIPAEGSSQRDRLARDHAGRVAVELRVLVVHPGHLARTRTHVGRGRASALPDVVLAPPEDGATQPPDPRPASALR